MFAMIKRNLDDVDVSITKYHFGGRSLGDVQMGDCRMRPEWLEHFLFVKYTYFISNKAGSRYSSDLMA